MAIGRVASALLLLAVLPGAAPTGSVDVTFEGLRSAKGLLQICVTTDPKHFPDCKGDPRAIARTISAARPHLDLTALPAGDYALSVIHDENGNGKLDTFAGIPREGVGFSRNPKLTFGPPGFGAVRFTVSGTGVRQSVTIKYFF